MEFSGATLYAKVILLSALLIGLKAHAQGVSADKIVIGSSFHWTGVNGAGGLARVYGHKALVKHVNDTGGINGRKLEIIELDDGYKPQTAVANTKILVEEKNVFALLNYVGTPIATAVLPLVEKYEIPFFGPISGAEFLQHPLKKYIFPVRPNFGYEAEALIRYATETKGIKDIGIFYQDDALGNAGRSAIFAALEKRDLKPVALGSHKRNDTNVSQGLEAILKARPKAVILWTLGNTAAEFAKRAAEKNYKPLYLGPSPVIPKLMIEKAGSAVEGAVFASGYPLETDKTIPIVKEFRESMAAAGYSESEADAYAFEFYFNGALLVEAMKRSGKDLNREILVKTLEGMKDVIFGGLKITLSESDHQALDKVYLVQIKNAKESSIN